MPLPPDLVCTVSLAAPLGRPPQMGESVRVRAVFTGGTPTGVRFVARRAGTADVPVQLAGADLDEAPAGTFTAAITFLAPGTWAVRAECDGPTRAADEIRIPVPTSAAIDQPAQGAPLLAPGGVPLLSSDPQAAIITNYADIEVAAPYVIPVVRTSDGRMRKIPASSVPPRQNVTATNPAVTDDVNAGYAVGSRWMNTASGQVFNCLSPTAGAAVWSPIDAADTPGPVPGGVYPILQQMAAGAVVAAADTAYALLLMPDFLATITAVGARVSVGGGTGAAFKTAVMPHDTATRRPGATALAANNAGTAATATGQLLGSLGAAAQIVPGQPVWVLGVFNTASPLPTVIPPPTNFLQLSQQLGLGIVGNGQNVQVTGFSTPFPFANNIGAANAFLGATWSQTTGSTGVNWVYGIT